MNPLAIVAILIAISAAYFGLGSFGPRGGFGAREPSASGPGRSAEIENPQPVSRRSFFDFGSGGSPEPAPAPRPGESPFKGKVRIVSVERSGSRAEDEYVMIRYGGGFFGLGRRAGATEQPIDVTGWKIASSRTSGLIPRAFNIAEIDASEQDVVLPPGGEVVVTTGMTSYPRNFRENRCVGYFNQFHVFRPSLANDCADDTVNRSLLINRGFNGACIEEIESAPSCRAPRGPFLGGVIGQTCVEYIQKNLNYAGCVANFRDQNTFLKNTWRVQLGRSQKLFDPRHDRVTLSDAEGLLVDEFEY